MALPNFLCVGAQKSGTTTLHNILKAHPHIFLPRALKELHFFDDDQSFSLGKDFYELTHFSEVEEQTCIGEITPSYMFMEQAPKRIYQTLGAETKLIFCLRNPIFRAYSHYMMNYGWLWETETFERAAELELERIASSEFNFKRYSYIARGLYFKQISNYLKYFDISQMHFVLFEDELLGDPQGCVNGICDFLGVNPISAVESVHSNKTRLSDVILLKQEANIDVQQQGRKTRINVPKGGVIVNPDHFGRLRVVKKPSPSLSAFIAKHISNRPESKLVEEGARRLYEQYFSEDVAQLESLIGKDISSWR